MGDDDRRTMRRRGIDPCDIHRYVLSNGVTRYAMRMFMLPTSAAFKSPTNAARQTVINFYLCVYHVTCQTLIQ